MAMCPLSKIMQNGILTADPEMNLFSALSIFLKNPVGCLPVVSKMEACWYPYRSRFS